MNAPCKATEHALMISVLTGILAGMALGSSFVVVGHIVQALLGDAHMDRCTG